MPKVAIDIGHGSNTWPERRSKGLFHNGHSYAEHDPNCEVALKHAKILKAHGIDVWYPQQPHERDRSLISRTNEANRNGTDLYVSHHHNAGSGRGVCAFYWHTSKDSKRLAEAIIHHIKESGIDTHGNGLHASQVGSWTDLHVCRETHMNAVLIEHGFMDDYGQDFDFIFGDKQEPYRTKCAIADARGVMDFLGVHYTLDSINDALGIKKEKKEKVVTHDKPKEEEDEMLKEAIIIGGATDYPAAEQLANRKKAPIYTHYVAKQEQVAKHVYIVGGGKEGIKADKVTDLSGKDRYETAKNVEKEL